MIDLGPSTQRTAALVTSVTDEQLGMATPCPQMCVADLIDHIGGLSIAFAAAARKDADRLTPPPPSASETDLELGWRDRIAGDLIALAQAWRDPQAWEGMTAAGGVDLPGEVAGLVALDEVVVHGWDLAVATSQPYEPDPRDIEANTEFVASFEAPADDGGLFGPAVPVADDAPPLDRLLGLTGRDPGWRPPG